MGELDEIRRDMSMAKKQLQAMRQQIDALTGTFASIERHLVKLFEWKLTVDNRLDALEGGKPPAA